MKSSFNLNDLKTMECPKCGNVFFTEVTVYKIVPRLLVPGASQDMKQPIGLPKCIACGWIEDAEKFAKPVVAPENDKGFLTHSSAIIKELKS